MSAFRRALRILFGLAGFAVGIATAISAFLARQMISPARQAIRENPADRGLEYEDVQFPAQDGMRVSGWFIPGRQESARDGATIMMVHGWQWNRSGYDNRNLISNLTGSSAIDLHRLIDELQDDGFNILTFDLRNHGRSATARPVTFGQSEAKDLLGALAYLQSRDDVNSARIGAIGFSIGANAVLFALPQTANIRAAMAIQPMTPSLFNKRVSDDLFGVFGTAVNLLSTFFYRLFGGQRLRGILPAFAAAGSGGVPILYVQGTGDEWGSVEDVSLIADMSPGTEQLLFVNSRHRFGGYEYVLANPAVVAHFFEEHL